MGISSPEKGGGGGPHLAAANRRIVPPILTAALLLVALSLLLWTTNISPIHNHFILTSFPQPDYLLPSPTAVNFASPNTTNISRVTRSRPPSWLSVHLDPNYTSTLLSRWLAPGGERCRDSKTENISVSGLDGSAGPVKLEAGRIHKFVITAVDKDGKPRCLGGDYFETDLAGESWKSRPPVEDHGDGSYTVYLQVHHDFAGQYNLTVILLFRNFEGLKFSPQRFAFRKEMRRIAIEFYNSSSAATPAKLRLCRPADFFRPLWSGRWTRHGGNDQCNISHDGRYRCLDKSFPCRSQWCHGPLGSLESNGWVYSAHCSFKIYKQQEAWKCLGGRWLFFWGDSNHVDTIRNVLNFVLGLWDIKSVPRRFDMTFKNPRNGPEVVRITSVFNGHSNETMNYEGLDSLRNDDFRDLLWRYFSEEDTPDVMVLNSGLHDGVHSKSIRTFAQSADYAVGFWDDVFRRLRQKKKRLPAMFYRTTIATGGYARDWPFNPSKMEAFNNVMVEKLKQKGLLEGGGVVDDFDLTFPWHYDNRCNDGVHYGRAPAKARWKDGEIGHQYFVDLMLGHVLLNAICGIGHHRQ